MLVCFSFNLTSNIVNSYSYTNMFFLFTDAVNETKTLQKNVLNF